MKQERKCQEFYSLPLKTVFFLLIFFRYWMRTRGICVLSIHSTAELHHSCDYRTLLGIRAQVIIAPVEDLEWGESGRVKLQEYN